MFAAFLGPTIGTNPDLRMGICPKCTGACGGRQQTSAASRRGSTSGQENLGSRSPKRHSKWPIGMLRFDRAVVALSQRPAMETTGQDRGVNGGSEDPFGVSPECLAAEQLAFVQIRQYPRGVIR